MHLFCVGLVQRLLATPFEQTHITNEGRGVAPVSLLELEAAVALEPLELELLELAPLELELLEPELLEALEPPISDTQPLPLNLNPVSQLAQIAAF